MHDNFYYPQLNFLRRLLMDSNDRNVGLVALFSFLIGGAVGAGVALLLAPQSGKKTRKQLKNLAEDITEQASEYTEKMKKKMF